MLGRLTLLQKLILVGVTVVIAISLFMLSKPYHPDSVESAAVMSHLPEQSGMTDEQYNAYIRQHFGEDSKNTVQLEMVARVGEHILARNAERIGKKTVRFHVLSESIFIDVFSTTHGDVYVTTALVNRMKTEGQLAAALCEGLAHVIAGDSVTAEKDAKPHYTTVQETQADVESVKLLSAAGYDPNALLGFFAILSEAYYAHADVTFFITHPNAANRLATIDSAIRSAYPQGVPAVLSK